MELIDKATLVAEIEKQGTIQPQLSWFTDKLIQIINDSIEVKEMDLDKEINRIWNETSDSFTPNCWIEFENIAKHFFNLGLKAQKGE